MKKDKTLILSQQTDEQEDEKGEEKPKTNEGFSSYIESLPKSTRQTVRCEKILHKIFYAHLPEKHPTHQLIQGIADRIFKEFNLSEEEFTLKIFQSDIPDVHVQFAEKELRLSSGFLELVEGDSDKIASVLAHEIGHVALAHFKTNDSETGKDHDPISEHIQHYEEEYQADRASTIITNRLGIPPKTLAETLQIIGVNATKKVKKIKEGDDAWDTKRQMWILNTHPHTRRRAMAIERDSRNLPRYPRTLRQQNIPIPKPKSFQGEPQDVDLWRVEYFNENLERRGPFSDCVWENVTPPKYEPKEVVSMRSIRSKNKEPDDYLTGDPLKYLNIKSEEIKDEKSGKNILLDFIPEEVNSWVEKNNGDCPVWWYQAMNSLDSEDAYHDLAADISEYSLETTLQLLNNCQPEYYILQKLDYDTRVEERDYIRETATQVALYGDEDFPPEFLITSSLLVRNWLEKDPSLKTLEGFSAIPAFLRSFIETHGTPLPYTGAQFFLQLEHFFTDAKTDQEREQLTVLYREYEKELSMHSSTVNSEAPHIMPTFAGYLTEHHPNEFFRIKGAQGKTSAHYELPNEIKNIQKQEVTKQEARELLKLIPSNYTPKNMGHIALSLAQDWEERGPKHEYSLEYASKMLSEEEFNERYFGRDRTAYEKTPYGEAEKSITELDDIAFLWNQSGYEKMLKDVPAGAPRLNALLETYPARCTNREKLISRILEWPELENIDDILTTQSQISECTNIEVLFALSDAFINPLLDISVGQQLWKIYQQDPEYFLTQVPVEHNQRVAEETADTPDSALSSELKAILLTHRHPTFVRDELLRTLVDKAPDKTSTLAIAGWYTEPPPGILRPRESGSVMVSETILDVMQRRDKLEKQELLLYFLGHRTFYSSIDKEHFIEVRKHEKDLRWKALTQPKEEFYESFRTEDDEESEEDDELNTFEPHLSRNYIVSTPDSLIMLQKATGIPIDLLTQQHSLMSTRREQRDFLTQVLLGPDGIATQDDREEFFGAAARSVTESSAWAKDKSLQEKRAASDLFSFALSNCPEERLPDLFLGIWNIRQENTSLPEVTTAMIRELGSLFIKGGQYLGTQSASLPLEWIQEFRKLSDQNIRAEKTLLYEHEHALFSSQSPFASLGEKLGEGSMAAVYKGELKKDGRKVAVKITHPDIEEQLPRDTAFLDKLVTFINERRDEFNIQLPKNLARVSSEQVKKELSFEDIVQNNEDITHVLDRSRTSVKWHVPSIDQEISRPGFIVYDYSEGKSIDQLSESNHGHVSGEIALELMRQILSEGVYQADPNIGNFKVGDVNPLHVDWLDTDHVGRLSNQETAALRELVRQITFKRDPKGISKSLETFVENTSSGTVEVAPSIEAWLTQSKALTETSVQNMEKLFNSFLDFIAENNLTLKENHVTLLRALGLMKPLLQKTTRGQLMRLTPLLMKP